LAAAFEAKTAPPPPNPPSTGVIALSATTQIELLEACHGFKILFVPSGDSKSGCERLVKK
jgi:hypothetical protein